GIDANFDHLLTVAVFPLRVILAVFLSEHHDFAAARFAHDCRHHARSAYGRRADLRLIAADHQHVVERDLVLVGVAEDVALDEEALAFRDAILLSTGSNDGKHKILQKMDRKRVNRGSEAGYSALSVVP